MSTLSCTICHRPSTEAACPDCLAPTAFTTPTDVDVAHERRVIQAGPNTIWRYANWLPVSRARDPLPVGRSPLVEAPRLASAWGIDRLWVKHELSEPTHSFKDRVVATATAHAVAEGHAVLACASTGNLAHAVAARAAAEGLPAHVFMPATVEPAKWRAAAAYGAHVHLVDGTYDEVNRLCQQLADECGWGFVNVNLRPWYAEGSKTIAFEVAEDLGWRAPDHVVAPVASGALYSQIAEALDWWRDCGLITGRTRLHGAQPSGCCPVASAFSAGETWPDPIRTPQTIAHSLAIGDPADGWRALEHARSSGGGIHAAPDEETIDAIHELAAATGILTEPAGGVTAAVCRRLGQAGRLRGEVVLVITGDGLKATDVLRGRPIRHTARLDDVLALV